MVASNLEAIVNALHAATPPIRAPHSSAAPAVGEPGLAKKLKKDKKRRVADQEQPLGTAPGEQQAQQNNGLVHGRKHDKRKEGGKKHDHGVPCVAAWMCYCTVFSTDTAPPTDTSATKDKPKKKKKKNGKGAEAGNAT